MYQITQSIFQLAQDVGVTFHFDAPVQKINVQNKTAKGVFAKSKHYDADVVVCNMDVVLAYQRLMPEQKVPKRILRQERSSSALIFYWGISQCFSKLVLHNIFFSKDYKQEFDCIFKHKTISNDPTVYINITCKENPADAPSGMENWFVMINVPHNVGQDWDSLIGLAREHIIAKLSRILKTDLTPLIIQEEILDPRTIQSKTQSYAGSLYGTSSNSRWSAFFRHPNFSSQLRNLYFCGGSVHPGGGIPLALSSAKIVGDLVPNG